MHIDSRYLRRFQRMNDDPELDRLVVAELEAVSPPPESMATSEDSRAAAPRPAERAEERDFRSSPLALMTLIGAWIADREDRTELLEALCHSARNEDHKAETPDPLGAPPEAATSPADASSTDARQGTDGQHST